MLRFSLALIAAAGLLAPLSAAEGLAALFDKQSHDFGNVPVGPTLRHDFTIKNTTNKTLHIGSLRVSCGCVTPSASTASIAPGKEAQVHALMDTRKFIGTKQVTVFVLFTQPQVEEVRLLVSAFGRTDVAINPDTIAFGQIRKGSSNPVTAKISFVGNTRVTEASCESGFVLLEIKEPQRTSYGLSYDLIAKMRADTPVGKWFADVWVKTDNNMRIRVPLTVEVAPTLTITPGSVEFTSTKVGTPVERAIVVKASQPFKIVDVKGGDETFRAAAVSNEAKATHLIRVTFAPGKEGDFAKSLEIVTDLKDEGKVVLPVKGKATPK